MKRRTLISALGTTAAMSALAGCPSLRDGEVTFEEVRLGLVTVSNRSDRDQTVEVILRRDGTTVNWTRHDIRARDGDVIPGDRIGCLLDEPAGAYEAIALLDRTGESFDLPLVPSDHETRDVHVAVTEGATVDLVGPTGPANEPRCRNAPVLTGTERDERGSYRV